MISGVVRAREGRMRMTVRGRGRKQREIEVVIDTGFSAYLTLPSELVASLGLRWKSFARGILADGRGCLFDVYIATVLWDGKERRVRVNETESDPLVGMSLLNGYELRMQVRSGGKIRISRPRPKAK